jgi:hypothetical protein
MIGWCHPFTHDFEHKILAKPTAFRLHIRPILHQRILSYDPKLAIGELEVALLLRSLMKPLGKNFDRQQTNTSKQQRYASVYK